MGKFLKFNNFTYQGEFINNKITGFGTMDFNNGDTYTGNFLNGKFNGYGELKNANGLG